MIGLPGSFSGRRSSPRPQRGPEPSSRRSLAILVRLTASTLSAPESSTIVSWVASASNLLGAVAKGRPVAVAASAAKSSAKPGGALSPVPTAVRSEEHTSELQSLMRISYAVFCLKNKKKTYREHKQK